MGLRDASASKNQQISINVTHVLLEVNTYLNVKHVVRPISVFEGSQRLTGHHSHNHQIVGQLDPSVLKYKILEPLTAVDESLRSIRCQQESFDTDGHHWKCFLATFSIENISS